MMVNSIARKKSGERRNISKDGNGQAPQGQEPQPPQPSQDGNGQAKQAHDSQLLSPAQAANGQASQGHVLQPRPALQGTQRPSSLQTQDPHISQAQQPEYFRTITDEYGIEILWVEFRNTKYKKNRIWDVPDTPLENVSKIV
jgi:hypothetical protein